MIDNLLKIDLPQAYGLTRPNVILNYHPETGTFELGDSKSCQACRSKFPERRECNEKTFKVDAAGKTLTVVDYEDYMNQFNGRRYADGGRCDLLMFDADYQKVAFCDMGCYSDAYVEQKRTKSHQQVCDSLRRFLSRPCGRSFIEQFDDRILIFARRDPAIHATVVPTPSRGDVRGNMQAFMTNPISRSRYAVSNEVIEEVPVVFIIVNYPDAYVW